MNNVLPLNIKRPCHYCGYEFTTSSDKPGKACVRCVSTVAQALREERERLTAIIEGLDRKLLEGCNYVWIADVLDALRENNDD